MHGHENIKNENRGLKFLQEAGLLAYCAVFWGNFFLKIRRNVQHSSSWIAVNTRTHKPEDEIGTFSRNVGKQLPNHTAHQARRLRSAMRKQVCR